ncbi:MAG: putative nucleic acid-binding protein, contains PIN domain [Phormidium sp. OSCR]|nr:MAG: putative nucleic acid-binding protein, contains PIN domain [Phormidium sp. OSCR]
MIVVSDTTPISELTKVGYLMLLPKLFGTVMVPEGVFNELQAGDHPVSNLVRDLSWLIVVTVNDRQKVSELQKVNGLDLGESEAIALAEEMGAAQVLIDERAARRVAKQRHLPLIGTMGVLLLAKRQGLLTQVKEILDKMQAQGTRISERLYGQVLTLAQELDNYNE